MTPRRAPRRGGAGPQAGAEAEQAARQADLERGQAKLAEARRQLDAQRKQLASACQALAGGLEQVERFHAQVLAEAEEQLLALALEIARKVLMQEVQAKRYEIDPIVAEALRHVPSRGGVVVHLNPEDYARCEQARQAEGDSRELRFVADVNVRPAECLLETPEGIVEASIEGNLSGVAEALGADE